MSLACLFGSHDVEHWHRPTGGFRALGRWYPPRVAFGWRCRRCRRWGVFLVL